MALERERRLLGDHNPEEMETLNDLLGRLHDQVTHVNEFNSGID